MMRTRRLVLLAALLLLACNAPSTAGDDFSAIEITLPVTEVETSDATVSPDDATCGLNALTTIDGFDVSGWRIYCDTDYGFGFKYPGSGKPTALTDLAVRILLPIAAGTTLIEKTVDIQPAEGTELCSDLNGSSSDTSEEVVINDVSFVRKTGTEGAAGSMFSWTSYSAGRDNRCVNLTFTLHDTNAGNYVTPPPPADLATESAVFLTIMKTFRWTKP